MKMRVSVALAAAAIVLGSSPVRGQGTGFTYQGRLTDTGVPVSSSYDMRFQLFDALTGGTQVGSTVDLPAVAVTGGLFTVTLDFGSVFAGSPRWLEIGVKPAGSPDPFTTLAPRQELKPGPYAIAAQVMACRPGFRPIADGRICMQETITSARPMLLAIQFCKSNYGPSRVCTHTDFQQACGDGFNPFGGVSAGFFGDHGPSDDTYHTWNTPVCADNADGSPANSLTVLPSRCCY